MFSFYFVLFAVCLASAEVLYPCGETATLECVTAYLADKAGCNTPEFPETDIFTAEPFLFENPYTRTSIYRYKNYLEGGIKNATYQLFTDSEADLTVFTWNFTKVHSYGRQQFQYHAPGQIDILLDSAYNANFYDIQTTAQLPGIETFSFGTGKIYSVIGSSEIVPNFEEAFPELTAEIARDPNGRPAEVHNVTQGNRALILREGESQIGLSIATVSLKYVLCDNS